MFSIFFFFSVYFARDTSKTAEPIITKSSRIMAKGCNKKIKLLVSELFLGWEGGSKRSLSLRIQLHKIQHGNKTDLLIEKQSCLILAG